MHYRDGDQGRDAVAFEIVKHGVRVEAPADDERGAERQAEREEGEPEAVEQGRRNEHRLAGSHRDMTDEGRPRTHQSAQRRGPRRALGRAGGPRGQEHQARRVAGPWRTIAPLDQHVERGSPRVALVPGHHVPIAEAGTLDRVGVLLVVDHDARAFAPNHLGELGSREIGVQEQQVGAAARAAEQRLEEPAVVAAHHGKCAIGSQAEVPAQPGRHGRGAAVELTVGERAPLIDQRRMVGMASRAKRHDGGQAQANVQRSKGHPDHAIRANGTQQPSGGERAERAKPELGVKAGTAHVRAWASRHRGRSTYPRSPGSRSPSPSPTAGW